MYYRILSLKDKLLTVYRLESFWVLQKISKIPRSGLSEKFNRTGKDENRWEELERQIDVKGLKIKEGVSI